MASTVHLGVSTAALDGRLSSASASIQIRSLSSALHAVVASVLAARQMAHTGDTTDPPNNRPRTQPRASPLLGLARSYRALLTSLPPVVGASLTPAQQDQETIRDLLLQLFKCLLPYAPSADAVHEVLKMIEGIDVKQAKGSTQSTALAATTNSSFPAPSSSPHSASSSFQWPFALCGMLIDACATSPSIPYILFDGESASTLVVSSLSAAAWPPGLAATQPTAAAAAALAQNNPSIGYTYSVWLYMESVIDAASLDTLDSCQPGPPAVPATAASAAPTPKLGDLGKSAKASSSESGGPNAARFTLINLCSDDGKTGMSLVYQADTGTLILRTGTAAARSPPSSTFSFRFNPIVNPTTYEFTNVGLIPHRWCHLLLTHTRGCLAGAHTRDKNDALMHPTASLYLDGQLTATARVSYVTRAASSSQTFKAWLGSGSVDSSVPSSLPEHAPSLRWRWRLASSVLLSEVLSEEAIQRLFDAGPRIAGTLPCTVSDKEGVLTSITPTVPGAIQPGSGAASAGAGASGSGGSNGMKVPLVDVVSGCYALPSACSESLDEIAALVSRQRKTGTFLSVGTAPVHSAKVFASTPAARGGASGGITRSSVSSPSSLHEHLLAPALSSEQELLTQTDMSPLESDSTPINTILDQQHIVWCFHARHAEERPLGHTAPGTSSSSTAAASGARAHTTLFNTGCSSSITCGDAFLYGSRCSILRPVPPQDCLRHIGGLRRILVLIEQCAKMPTVASGPAGAGYTDELNPSTALRQCFLLMLMCLRRHPKNFRDMHALDGYKLLGFFLRQISRRKFRIRERHTPTANTAASPHETVTLQPLVASSSRQFTSPAPTASSAGTDRLPPLGSPDKKRSVSNAPATSSSSHPPSTASFTLRPFLDAHIVDLIFALVGLSEKGMGGYVANLLALEYLLLDYRLWERTPPDVQLYVFQGLINACVGNPDRAANITALREARFVPWLLVILTNTKTFEPTSASAPHTNTKAGVPRVLSSQGHPEMGLLHHILTLLRVLLMSELIDQELHLLANFAMTRTILTAKSKETAANGGGSLAGGDRGAGSQRASASPVPGYSPMPGASPTPSDYGGSMSGSPMPASYGHAATSAQPAVSDTALTARRIQKSFIEMLLDVLLKISASSSSAGGSSKDSGGTRAMQIFTKSISFHWIFGVLKGEKARLSIDDRVYPAFAPPSYGPIPPVPQSIPEPPDADCAILTLKILLVLLESPARLQEFRSSSLANSSASSQAAQAAQARMADGLEPDAETLGRIISFASLSNLLLPYASCARLYPILLCILLGKSIHHLSMLPQELSVDTVEEIFQAFQEGGARTQLALVVPEVIDVLVDLLARCLHILADEQQVAFETNPASFFSAAAAVASFVPPSTPHAKVYADVYDTGILSAANRPEPRQSKFGIDHSKWNAQKEDQLPSIERTHGVRTLIGLDRFSQSGPAQSIHDPASIRAARKPAPLATTTPTASSAASTPQPQPPHPKSLHTSTSPASAGGSGPSSTSSSSEGSSFTFGSRSAQSVASSVAPSTSLLNGLLLFFMRLLHSSEDFGRVVSRSTFLRPLVAAAFASAHLNPIVSLATLPPAPIPSARPASAQAIRPSRIGGVPVGYPPMAPSTSHSRASAARALAFGQAGGPQAIRAQSSAELTGDRDPSNPLVGRALEASSIVPASPSVLSLEPDAAARPATLGVTSPFSPDSANPFSRRSMSPDSSLNPLRSPPSQQVDRDSSQMQLFSPTSFEGVTLGLHASVSPPVPSALARMDLMSPTASESPSQRAAPAATGFGMLASPEYIAFQQAQLGFLAAPASPPGSPSAGQRRVAPATSTPFDVLQLSIEAASTPSVAYHHALFQGQLSVRSQSFSQQSQPAGGPHSLSTNTHSAFFSPSESQSQAHQSNSNSSATAHGAFTFTPKHHPPAANMTNDQPPVPSALGLGHASELLEAQVSGDAASLSPENGSSSPESPAVLLSPSASGGLSSSIRIPIFRHSTSQLLLRFMRQIILYHLQYKKDGWLVVEKVLDAFPSVIPPSPFEFGGAPPAAGVDSYTKNEELIRGFQSAVMSIVVIRLQEKLAAAHAPPGLFVTAGSGHSAGGASTSVGGQPSKFLLNLARTSELIFLRIQSGLFQSAQWSFEALGRVGGLAHQSKGASATWSTLVQGGSRASNTASSAAGLLQTLVAVLTHDGLKAHTEELSSATAAAEAKASHRRRSSHAYGGPTTPASATSTFAALTASPLNKALRSVADIVMNCVLHLYDQFTLKEIPLTDVTQLNCFLFAHRRVILSEYMLAAHVSEYISSTNTLGGAPPSAAATTTFTSRSFVACLLYHLYYFQLNASATPTPTSATANMTIAAEATGSRGALSDLSPSSSSHPSAQPRALGDLRHSALSLLIWLIRSKPILLSELMRATIVPGADEPSTPGLRSQPAPVVPEPGVPYDLFTRGFDVLLSGFSGPSGAATPSSTPSPSPSTRHRMAEVDGFFDWLAIQQPLIESVFARTLLPEWRAYCKFLNGFLYAANTAAMARVDKIAERDAENAALDGEELATLHAVLERLLADASQVDSNRYLRRLQALVEQEAALKKNWRSMRQEILRLYALFSSSRQLYPAIPKRSEWSKIAKHRRSGSPARTHPGASSSSAAAAAGVSSDSSDDGDLLVPSGSVAWRQSWKLDPIECSSRLRVRLVRAQLGHPNAPLFTFPYKREADELREARRLQEAFLVRQAAVRKEAALARKAAASVPLVDRTDDQLTLERGCTVAAAATRQQDDSDGDDQPASSPMPLDISSPTAVVGHASTHQSGLVLAVDPTPLAAASSRLHFHLPMADHSVDGAGGTDGHSSATPILSPDRAEVELTSYSGPTLLPPAYTSRRRSLSSGPTVEAARATAEHEEAADRVAVELSSFNSPSSSDLVSAIPSALHTGRLVPESSDRPVAIRRVATLTMTPLHSGGHSAASPAVATMVAPGSAKRKPTFFPALATTGGSSTRHLLTSSRHLHGAHATGGSPSHHSPNGGGGGGDGSPIASERVDPLQMYAQTGIRRGVSFDAEPSPDSAASDDMMSPGYSHPPSMVLSPQSGVGNGGLESTPGGGLHGGHFTMNLPSPPNLEVETPGGQHVRGANSMFSPSQMMLDQQQQHHLHDTALSDVLESSAEPPISSLLSSPSSSPRASSAGGSHHTLDHAPDADAYEETNAYYSSLLTEEYTWFLYEERLRLLLDEEQINYHYNCLRIEGLQELSAIFLLCTNSIFIVDQYQVNPDGSIVRLEAVSGGGAGERNALVSDGSADGESDGGQSTSRRWNYSDIVSVHKRRYLLRPAALELFFADHSNYFLVVNIKQRELIYKNLLNLCPNITDGHGGGLGTANAAASAAAQAAQAEITSAIASGSTAAAIMSREMSARLTSSTVGLDALTLPPAVGTDAAGVGVGVGGLTSFVHQELPPAPAIGMNRLTSNLSSLFFANHTLATEGGLNQLTAVVAAALDNFTTEWQHGFLSNFDYLMLLNSFSGRSFNDLTQYPVFPWVLADYDSPELDLDDPAAFRDLARPMGALDPQRAQMHRHKYRETEALWRDEEREGAAHGTHHSPTQNAFIAPGVSRAYHYGTHYSSAAIVMYYLLRVEPFSQHLISFQSGRFDRADRLFSSIKQTYLTASKVLSGDVKELIPELFYFAPMLQNGNDLDLGHRQDGRPVSSVLLPPWAKGSPREFIRLHRLALESPHVSAHLHLWIDLIFGAKQTGDAAVRALNVFHYVTYAGHVDIDKITDPVLRRGMIEQTRSFGQTPATLFAKSHPPRLVQPTAGRMWTQAHTMQPTDTTVFPHTIAQIFCIDQAMLLSGVTSSSSMQERLLIGRPHQLLAVPNLQPVSSFLPYAECNNPPVVSSRNVRLSKSYRASPMFNKASFVHWRLPDGAVRAGLMDIGATQATGLESAMSIGASLGPPSSTPSGPTVRSVKSYLNLHDGQVRVAAMPLEGDDGTLVTGGADNLVCIWQRSDLGGGGRAEDEGYALVAELAGHRAPITSLVVSKGFSLVVSGAEDGAVILWDLVRLHAVRTLRYTLHGARITHVAINLCNGDIAFAADDPPALCMTDVNGTLLARYPDPRALSRPDVPYALKRDYPLDTVTSLSLSTGIGHRDSRHQPTAGGFHADTTALLLTGHASGVIRIWHLRWLAYDELFSIVAHPSASAESIVDQPRHASAPSESASSVASGGGATTSVESAHSDTSGSAGDDTVGLGSPLVRTQEQTAVDPQLPATHLRGRLSGDGECAPSIVSPANDEFDREIRSVMLRQDDGGDFELPESSSIEAGQLAARHLSNRVFGAPGEEQLPDEWMAAGLVQGASMVDRQLGPVSVGLTSAPRPRAWHLLCVGELLGHQVPVTALSLPRHGDSLYSGDANGNVVHFTSQEDAFAHPPCACKQSHSRTRLKLYHSLLTGSTSASLTPSRVRCSMRGCEFVGCEFDWLDHVRAEHGPTDDTDRE